MTEKELLAYSKSLGVEPKTILTWSLGFRKTNPFNRGKPKGKQPRPKGMLSIADAIEKYGVDPDTLRAWREEGMEFEKIGSMIVMRDADVKEWTQARLPDPE